MHVVVVDRSRVVLKFVAGLLEPFGHKISLFTDALAALACVERDPSVDVLLTSLEIEPISGIELVWQARLAATPQRPLHIVVMSSRDSDRTVAEALDSGADDVIAKPVTRESLRARLRAAERIMILHRHLAMLAETDPLTGLLNRRAFFDRIRALGTKALAMPVVVCDVDHFKRVNDTYGHDAGDAVLCRVAREVANAGPLAVRLGGEEFAMALPGHDVSHAIRVAERLRASCAALTFDGGGKPFSITSSFGVSLRDDGESIEEALKTADRALYRAKSSGRNRVVVEPAHLAAA